MLHCPRARTGRLTPVLQGHQGQIFGQYLQTFAGVNQSTNDVAYMTYPTPGACAIVYSVGARREHVGGARFFVFPFTSKDSLQISTC